MGYALYRFEEGSVYLRQFFVNREDRRKGIGRVAVQLLKESVWRDRPRIRLEVLSANKTAQRFWKDLGFEVYSLTLESDLDSSD